MKWKLIKKLLIIVMAVFMVQACGPLIITSHPHPSPPWFYPHHSVSFRYVYFPDYYFYYDFYNGVYVYLDNGVWITTRLLPSKLQRYDLRRSRQVRMEYLDDNIQKDHRQHSVRYPIRENRVRVLDPPKQRSTEGEIRERRNN